MTTGQRVVCVDDRFPDWIRNLYVVLPVKGRTYVIREVMLGCDHAGQPGEVAVLLVGLHNPRSKTPPHPEWAFNSVRFVPLEDVTDDVMAAVESGELLPA